MSTSGWNARLFWLWILCNTVGFVVVLVSVAVLAWIGADALQLAVANRHLVLAMLEATVGALLFGSVLGSLQWLVIRERAPVARRRWVVASVGPALLGWLLVIMPALISASDTDRSVSGAYLLAASQTLALGPLLGLSQAVVLRRYTIRWAWWIAANSVSWLLVDAVFILLSHWLDWFDFARGDGPVAGLYLMLVATTPLTGRMLLWVLAPSALLDPGEPMSSDATPTRFDPGARAESSDAPP